MLLHADDARIALAKPHSVTANNPGTGTRQQGLAFVPQLHPSKGVAEKILPAQIPFLVYRPQVPVGVTQDIVVRHRQATINPHLLVDGDEVPTFIVGLDGNSRKFLRIHPDAKAIVEVTRIGEELAAVAGEEAESPITTQALSGESAAFSMARKGSQSSSSGSGWG